MKFLEKAFKGFLFLLLAGILTGTAAAQVVTIPQNATINSAMFTIVSFGAPNPQTIFMHRIVKNWDEMSVTWNSFMLAADLVTPDPGFDPAPFASFSTAIHGPHPVDVTALVQAWVNGGVPNYGILLSQGMTQYTQYVSSEFTANVALRPKLDITYTVTGPGGVPVQTTVTIQRPGLAADAYIHGLSPTTNFGNVHPLWTGNVGGFEKYSLVRFYFDVVPDRPSPGTGTPGYWMNHPEAWPIDPIVIGGVTYTKDQAIAIMMTPPAGDMTKVMFFHLVAAILNVEIGNAAGCISGTITDAQDWMSIYPIGSGVAGKSAAWKVGDPLKTLLDSYNNGLMCAPHRD